MWIVRSKSSITAKKLGRILNCRASYKYLPRNRQFIINYGGKYRGANLNPNIITNKLTVSQILKENGIETPKTFTREDEIQDNIFPCLARRYYHSQGKDIIYIHNKQQLEECWNKDWDYLISYVNKTSEYRVHVLGDDIAMVNVKFTRDDYADPIVRCKHNGWKQISYEGQWKERLVEIAQKVLKVLNYDFGAVDIIRKKDKFWVLEINSAPGLEPRKLTVYSNYFKKENQKFTRAF
jgi:glutathione synthase/RimK-type ligase-like ATP-grasp enzyme